MSGLVRLAGRRFIADPVPVANAGPRIIRRADVIAVDCPAGSVSTGAILFS